MSTINEVEALDQEIATLQAKRKAILDSKRTDALKGVKDSIRTFGFTAQELGLYSTATPASTDSKPVKKREPKYANPDNASETWAGGAKPKWVKAYEAKGGKVEDLKIKK